MEQHFLGGELFDPGFGNQLSKIVRRERVDGNQGFQDVQVAHGSTRGGMGMRHFSQRGNGRVEKYWRKWRRGRPLRASRQLLPALLYLPTSLWVAALRDAQGCASAATGKD